MTVAYLRVSTAGQAESGAGLAAQRSKCRALATLHETEVDQWFVDAGASGASLERPELGRLLAEISSGSVQMLLVAKLDRLTRSVADLARLIEVVNRRGVRLVSAEESIDTGTACGRLILQVLGAVSQWEREAIAERTSAALRARRAAGRRAGTVPFGWSADPDGLLVENPAERAVVVRARELRSAGCSLRVASAKLASEGLVTRGGRAFSAEGLRRLLLV